MSLEIGLLAVNDSPHGGPTLRREAGHPHLRRTSGLAADGCQDD